ncbi:MAG: secretin and TonB N-terminal domain-containing protein [Candidatus Omnitrophica bacterium]|nr:secretin and TonB N-terminal domain-containing protein [Candidatus Omnitrophota bacterium]
MLINFRFHKVVSFLLIVWLILGGYLVCTAQNPPEETKPETLDASAVALDSKNDSKKIILDTLELRDMDINDVLKLVAAKSGLNIIAGKGVQGRVTIYLKNVEVHDALTIILKSNDLAYIEEDDIVRVMTGAEYEQLYGIKFGKHIDRQIIHLKSMKASDAINLLNQFKSANGRIVADEQSNTLMIEDVPEISSYMVEYLTNVDLPTEWKVFNIQNVPVEGVASKLLEQISPKIGVMKTDLASNKLFVKDTAKKLAALQELIQHIDVSMETRVFELNYAKAEDVVKTITPLLTKDIGSVQSDVRSNKIMVTDIDPKIQEIRHVIEAVDRKEKEVLIDARIVQIELDDSYKMGIDWDAIIKQNKNLTFTNNFSLPSNVPNPPLSTTAIGTLNSGNYGAILSMIGSMGKTKILSNPHIAVVNNEEAKILVGTNQPYSTSTTTTPATGAATTAEAVSFIEVGVKLHVTPSIHEDGFITMKIHPEVSSVTGTYTSTSNGSTSSVPVVSTSEVDTIVRVKDGVTIIIGGLIKDEVDHVKDKLPILGDIPLMGKVFSREQRNITKTETVIFLTPHIMSGDANTESDMIKRPDMDTDNNKNKTYYSPFNDQDSPIQK